MPELMARGGMRVGEPYNLTPVDIQERTLSGRGRNAGYPVHSYRDRLINMIYHSYLQHLFQECSTIISNE